MNVYVWGCLWFCQTLIVNVIDLGFLTIFCFVPNILKWVPSWKQFCWFEQARIIFIKIFNIFSNLLKFASLCLASLVVGILANSRLNFIFPWWVSCFYFGCTRRATQICLSFWLLRVAVVGHLYFFSMFEKIINVKHLCINHSNMKK